MASLEIERHDSFAHWLIVGLERKRLSSVARDLYTAVVKETAMNANSWVLRCVLLVLMSLAVGVLGGCKSSWQLETPVEEAWAEPSDDVVLWPWRVEHSNGRVSITFFLIGQREVIGPRRESLGYQLAFGGLERPVFRISDLDHREVELDWDNGDSWSPFPYFYDPTSTLGTEFLGRTPNGKPILRATVQYHGRLWSGREYLLLSPEPLTPPRGAYTLTA
ncbi:MAG: hypothetical protein IT434_10560 [Phycisphaerales bacterium]|nr:hypothetical protein [Phycisphaerales bacterium]